MARREVGSGITRYQKPEGIRVDRPVSEVQFQFIKASVEKAAARPLWDRSSYVAAFERALGDIVGDGPYDPMDFKPHEDWAWYYHNLIRLDRITRNRIERGEAGLATLSACEFGQLFTELQIKLVWEKDALRGRKTLEAASRGGEMRSRDIAKQAHLFSAYQKRKGKMPEPTALQHAAREAGYTTRHARRLIPKPTK